MDISKLYLKLTNINVTNTTVDSINVEISIDNGPPISSNVDFSIVVKKLNINSLDDINTVELSADAKTITLGNPSTISYNDLIVVVAKNNSSNIVSNRLIVDFYQQFNSNITTLNYIAPSDEGKFELKLDFLGDFLVPKGINNNTATISTAKIDHIKDVKISVEKQYLVKIAENKINVLLELPGVVNDTEFGYEVVINEEKK